MNIIEVFKNTPIKRIKLPYYSPINYWVLDISFIELNKGEQYQIDPDGFSYIIYTMNSTANYLTPFLKPFILKTESTTKYYLVKCRPTYVSILLKNKNLRPNLNSANEFLTSLDSEELKNIYPTVLESIVFHMRFTQGQTSIKNLKERYQCTSADIEDGFKNILGLSFTQYQSILLTTT